MIRNLYEQLETDASFQALLTLAHDLPEPVVLLGGWAVFLMVNERFEEENGLQYLGSRDVDVGFHIDPGWSLEELKNSTFARAETILEEIGYMPIGTSRFCRIVHRETNRTLNEEVARFVPQYDLFYLYVDPIVDNIHPGHHDVFQIKPIDEPFLTGVFKENLFTEIYLGEAKIFLPRAEILIATKLKSFQDRNKFDKKIKDACDIYSLLWYSPVEFKHIVSLLKEKYQALCLNAHQVIESSIAERASGHLGIDPGTFTGVVRQLI